MRGNRGRNRRLTLRPGSIPAHAGEPDKSDERYRNKRVYPRACGGTWTDDAASLRYWGLSPRMRGNHRGVSGDARRQGSPAHAGEPSRPICGSIPAHAGEPVEVGASLGLSPRMRGNPSFCRSCGPWKGSQPGLSPRMRGNREVGARLGVGGGSIPAHAGDPWSTSRWTCSARVYPRACGGTSGKCILFLRLWGLSPRMRGNHGGLRLELVGKGSIPAHAGEPEWPSSPGAARLGLSPRMRGNLPRDSNSWACPGSIPAHAGEPNSAVLTLSTTWVYPRACGGTTTSPTG